MDLRGLLKKYKEPIAYLFWGGATTVVNYVLYFLCTKVLHIHYITSNVLAWAGAVVFAFVVNKLFVFDSKSWKYAVVLPEFLTAHYAPAPGVSSHENVSPPDHPGLAFPP